MKQYNVKYIVLDVLCMCVLLYSTHLELALFLGFFGRFFFCGILFLVLIFLLAVFLRIFLAIFPFFCIFRFFSLLFFGFLFLFFFGFLLFWRWLRFRWTAAAACTFCGDNSFCKSLFQIIIIISGAIEIIIEGKLDSQGF